MLQDAADLAGLPDSLRADAAAAAAQAGLAGRWLIANTRSAMTPFITYAQKRTLREQGWRLWTGRGDHGDANDNNAVIAEILQCRRFLQQGAGPVAGDPHLAGGQYRAAGRGLQALSRARPRCAGTDAPAGVCAGGGRLT